MKEGYFLRSSHFQIEPGEDNETNPRRYGKHLASWLKVQLEGIGYSVEAVIAEDWGWCVMCQRNPFSLWVGCGNRLDYETARPGDPPPHSKEVIWHCFPHAEVPLLKRMFRKVDTEPAVEKLNAQLLSILVREPSIELISAAEHGAQPGVQADRP